MKSLLQISTGVYRKPWIVITVAAIITVFFAIGLPSIRFDNSIRSMLPADNHELNVHDYYEDEDRFGKSAVIYLGVESSNAFAQEQLEYLRLLENQIGTLNKRLPPENLSRLVHIPIGDAQTLIAAMQEQGINAANFATDFMPLLRSSSRMISELNWQPSLANQIELATKNLKAEKLYMMMENPIRNIDSIVNTDYIVNRDDTLVTEPMIAPDLAITPEVAQTLRQKLETWDVYQGTLYAQDGTLSNVVVRMNNVDPEVVNSVVKALRAIIDGPHPDATKVWMDGEGVITAAMGTTMRSDLQILMPLVILMVMLVLFLCFRNLAGVVYPMIVVLISVVCSLGAMAWLGVPISIASVSLPPLMVAIASAYGIHQINHFQLDQNRNKLEVLTHNMGTVGLAILLSGITVMFGFGALAAENFVPIRNFGLFTALGDLVAVSVALWVLPALLLIGGPTKARSYQPSAKDFIDRFLAALVTFGQRHAWPIVIGSLLLTLICSIGIVNIKSELNNVSFFKSDSEIRMADDKLNQKLAGTQTVNIILDSDPSPLSMDAYGTLVAVSPATIPQAITTPAVLERMNSFASDVTKEFTYATKVLSFSSVLKKMNQEMNGGDPAWYRIPSDANLISQYLLIFSGDLQNLLSSNRDKMRIAITLKRVGTAESEQVATFARNYFNSSFCKENNLHIEITGSAHLYYVANNLLMDGMIKSIIICVFLVFFLMLFVLRSLRMTAISLIPIAATLVINFGLLGLFGIPLNTATAMVSSVAVGIGVDYSIHFITWYRLELSRHQDIEIALNESILHKGRAILFNMLVIIAGFIVLVASNFVPLIQFGILVSLCMVSTALGALVLVPAVIRLLARKPRPFLYLRQIQNRIEIENPGTAPVTENL